MTASTTRMRSTMVCGTAAILAIGMAAACSPAREPAGAAAAPAESSPAAIPVTFVDVTEAAGIRFRHQNGAFGAKYLPETMGSGAVFLDVDQDGWQDLFLVNSTKWPGRAGTTGHPALYRNNRDGTFHDVTADSGLRVELYGMGGAAADFDNDGLGDLYVTAYGRNRLFRNRGGWRFDDVTAAAGVAASGFSTGAAWVDYDRDGLLDLFVLRYVQWALDKDLFCTLDGTTKSYCTPESYQGQSAALFRNRGDGTFDDVTQAAGVFDPASKALGVALMDADNDGWIDLFVANDTRPNRLYRNRGDGTFEDIAPRSGVAFNDAGVARAGMGVDAADYDGSGRQSVVIGNFSNEMIALYTNEGTGAFVDEAPATTVGRASLRTLAFGAFFFDYDLDGRVDIFAANGHVADDVNRVQPNVTYAQPPHLFRNLGGRRFDEATPRSGSDLGRPLVGRGAAYADYDRDGDLDVLITTNNGPAHLLRNDGGNRHNAVRVGLVGSGARDAIGARVQVLVDGRPGPWAMVKTGSSYLSQSELPVTLGLGETARVSGLRVTWPGGTIEEIPAQDANQHLTIRQGAGVVDAAPFLKPSAGSAASDGPGSSAARGER